MANEPIASTVSAPGAINGNEHNSSPDFQFVSLPASGSISIAVSGNTNADSITFNLWEDRTGRKDEQISDSPLSNGSTISVNDVELGNNYYIGDPSHASNQNFVVTFSAEL